MRSNLRIGIFIDSCLIPYWTYKVLEQILHSNFAKIEIIVKNDSEKTSRKNVVEQFKDNFTSLLYKALLKLDGILFHPQPDAFEQKEISHLLKDIPVITSKPIQKQFFDYFTSEDINKFKSYNIDVFIKFGFRILKGEILNCARYGVWAFHHGDDTEYLGGLPGFWEVLECYPETGSTLQILTDDEDAGTVLARSYFQTDPLSFKKNRNNLYWQTLSTLQKELKELYISGGDNFFESVRQRNLHPSFYSRRLYPNPGNVELIGLIIKFYFKYLISKIKPLFYLEKWILLYSLKDDYEFSSSFCKFKKIIPPKDRFWADPHVIFKDGKYYVFFEEYMYKTGKAHISYLMIDENGNCTLPKKIIDKPYHLSYPFVFSYDKEFYMVPESCQNRTIELYKCIDFPEKWELAKVLMKDINAVDTTLLMKDGKWWIFVNIEEDKGDPFWDELFLFYSTDLLGTEWISHPQNPVVSDVKSARSAGKIFTYNGKLYRPSQNNLYRYGYGMKINLIETLNETEYKEVCTNTIEPYWDKNILGTHTINFVKGLTVIDGELKSARYFSF